MAEQRIIARATAAGTRRLTAVPLEPLSALSERGGAAATATAPPTGLTAFLAAAQRQGTALVDSAREQAETIAADAAREGFEAGYEAGRRTAEQEVADLLAFAEATVREVSETRARILEENETAL